jgi:hypothetical protein
MDKGNRVATTRQVFKNLYDAGIATQAMGIFGFPGEKERDGDLTVRFLEENTDRISYYVMGLLMVLPGSRMHRDPEKYGIASIAYPNNPMMTPMPVWKSNSRMSVRSVNRLYERLSRLEDLYVINDYPYLGALSTNHGFLYFEQGPDILKRLRSEEDRQHRELHRTMGIDEEHRVTRPLKAMAPRRTGLPFTIYHTPYPVERIQTDLYSPPEEPQLFGNGGGHYLVDPINPPLAVGVPERKILERIDSKRKLKNLMSKYQNTPEKFVQFIINLIARGLVELSKPRH